MSGVIEEEPGELALASEFRPATREQWQRLVARVLGSSSDAPELELATVTADGIEILPLYVADDARPDPGYPGQASFVRGRTAAGHQTGWDVRQRHAHPDPAVKLHVPSGLTLVQRGVPHQDPDAPVIVAGRQRLHQPARPVTGDRRP